MHECSHYTTTVELYSKGRRCPMRGTYYESSSSSSFSYVKGCTIRASGSKGKQSVSFPVQKNNLLGWTKLGVNTVGVPSRSPLSPQCLPVEIESSATPRLLRLNSQVNKAELRLRVGDTPLCVSFRSDSLEGIWPDIVRKTKEKGLKSSLIPLSLPSGSGILPLQSISLWKARGRPWLIRGGVRDGHELYSYCNVLRFGWKSSLDWKIGRAHV